MKPVIIVKPQFSVEKQFNKEVKSHPAKRGLSRSVSRQEKHAQHSPKGGLSSRSRVPQGVHLSPLP